MTVALLVQWRGAKLFLDSESEGKTATPKGLAIEEQVKWCYNVNSDGRESKAVLEFVAVGAEPTTPLCPIVNGGGNSYSLWECQAGMPTKGKLFLILYIQ